MYRQLRFAMQWPFARAQPPQPPRQISPPCARRDPVTDNELQTITLAVPAAHAHSQPQRNLPARRSTLKAPNAVMARSQPLAVPATSAHVSGSGGRSRYSPPMRRRPTPPPGVDDAPREFSIAIPQIDFRAILPSPPPLADHTESETESELPVADTVVRRSAASAFLDAVAASLSAPLFVPQPRHARNSPPLRRLPTPPKDAPLFTDTVIRVPVIDWMRAAPASSISPPPPHSSPFTRSPALCPAAAAADRIHPFRL